MISTDLTTDSNVLYLLTPPHHTPLTDFLELITVVLLIHTSIKRLNIRLHLCLLFYNYCDFSHNSRATISMAGI